MLAFSLGHTYISVDASTDFRIRNCAQSYTGSSSGFLLGENGADGARERSVTTLALVEIEKGCVPLKSVSTGAKVWGTFRHAVLHRVRACSIFRRG